MGNDTAGEVRRFDDDHYVDVCPACGRLVVVEPARGVSHIVPLCPAFAAVASDGKTLLVPVPEKKKEG